MISRFQRLSQQLHPGRRQAQAGLRRWFRAGLAARGAEDYPPHQVLRLAALSPTMTHGGIARWTKTEGEEITAGDVVAEVETDKATVDLDFLDDAVLAKILVPEGTSEVPVQSPIAILVDDADSVGAFAGATASEFGDAPADDGAPAPAEEAPAAVAAAPAAAPAAPAPVAPAAAAPVQHRAAGERVIASPYARKLAREAGIDIGMITVATGPNGRIIARDVEEALTSGTVGLARAAPLDFAHNATRHSIAASLTQAKRDVPHYYLTVDVDLTDAVAMREKLLAERGVDISINDFVLKARHRP